MKKILFLILLFSSSYGVDFTFIPDYASINLRIATNYQIFANPWEYPLDVPSFNINTSLPVSINRWQPDISGLLPENYFGLNSSVNTSLSLGFKNASSISASFPFMLEALQKKFGFKGAISVEKTKNLDFDLATEITNLKMNTDGLGGTSGKNENVQVKLKALLNSPTFYNMQWETFSIGYIFSPSKDLVFSTQLNRHRFALETDNYINMDMYGYVDYNGIRSNIEYNLPDREGDEVYMRAIGKYEGSKWVPVFGLKASKLSFVFRPGTTVELDGKYKMGFSLPFFFDIDNLMEGGFTDENIIDQNALLNNPAKISSGETTSQNYETTDNSYGKIPTNFSFGVDVYKEYLNLNWTHFNDAFVLNHTNGENSKYYIDENLAPDSLQYKGKQNFYLYVKISNIFMLSGKYNYFDYTLGYMDFTVRREEDVKLQENLPIPILGLGARTKTKYELYTKIYISPIPSIVGGFRLNL